MNSWMLVLAMSLPVCAEDPPAQVAARNAAAGDITGDDLSATMPITVQQCIYLAEKHSLPLRMAEVDVQIAKAALGGSLGAFDTIYFAEGIYTKANRPTASALERGDIGGLGGGPPTADPGAPEIIVTSILTETWDLNTGFRGTLLNGATYTADVDWVQTETSAGTFGGFNPEYRSGIGLAMTQPLLKGHGTAVNKAPIQKARNEMQASSETLEEQRLDRALEVITAYWFFYISREFAATREFLVEQGQKLVRINEKKLEVGDARKLDVIEAESDLASRNKDLLTAQNDIGDRSDDLKRLIFPFDQREEWDLELLPLTEAQEESIDPPGWQQVAAVALERRPALRRRRQILQNNDLDILVAENEVLPRFDLNGSLRFNNLADSKGEVLNYEEDFYTISAGFSLEMPLGNRGARYGLASARLQKIRALLEYKDAENQVVEEVRAGVRDTVNRKKEIDAAKEAVRLALERWSAEQKRQEVGYSTTFQVRDAQAAWQEAKDAELQALFDYQVAIATLDRAQGTLLEKYGILPAPKPVLDDRAGIHFDS